MVTLRRKILLSFATLAALALVIAAMTAWTTAQWGRTEVTIQAHYERSLHLQNMRAAMFRALLEVPDAVLGRDVDARDLATGTNQSAREQFSADLKEAERHSKQWSAFADTPEEKEEVTAVRGAYETLVRNANRCFDLVEAKRLPEAIALVETQLEDAYLYDFQTLTDRVIAADRNRRARIQKSVQATRRTAQVVLAIAAFGALSLTLLLTAFLASNLFAPLQEVEQALDDVMHGNLEHRLEEERDDELGAVNRAYNRMAEAVAQRERVLSSASVAAGASEGGENGEAAAEHASLTTVPSRVVLHRLVGGVRERVAKLTSNGASNGHRNGEEQVLLEELDRLSQALTRVTEFGMPLGLNLARSDVRALLYEVPLRFQDELARGGISYELDIAPEVDGAVVDKLKLREALGEFVRNSIARLPERGGHLGIRASVDEGKTELVIEVADDGEGIDPSLAEQSLIDQALTGGRHLADSKLGVGLRLAKGIIEQHGGTLHIQSRPGRGTHAEVRLPLRS